MVTTSSPTLKGRAKGREEGRKWEDDEGGEIRGKRGKNEVMVRKKKKTRRRQMRIGSKFFPLHLILLYYFILL